MDKVRVGFIGAGNLAKAQHYPSLAEFEDVELVAACDLIEEKARAMADKYGIPKVYTDARKMVETEAPDAVYIIMPPHHLYDLTVWCLEQKKHVFIEKPPAVTTYQVQSLAAHAMENQCLTMVGFNRRFIPMLVKAKEAVRAAGPIHYCVATFYKDGAALSYYKGAIGILHCDAIHAVDALRWMADSDVEAVASCVARHDDARENSFQAVLRFRNGCSGVLLAHWATGTRVHTFEMHTRGVSAFLNPNDKGTIFRGEEVETLDTKEVAGSAENRVFYGFTGEDRHFIDCVKAGRQPGPNFQDAAKTMALADRILACSV